MILPIMRVYKNTLEKVDLIFLKTAHQSCLVKTDFIVHNKCSQADIAHNSVNRSIPSNILQQISAFKQTDGCRKQSMLKLFFKKHRKNCYLMYKNNSKN